MRVFADRERRISPVERLRAIEADVARGGEEALTDAFVSAAELAQALIDAEFDATGHDDWTPLHRAALGLLSDLASRLRRPSTAAFVNPLAGVDLPRALRARKLEGFAHYAVYPRAFLAAGEGLGATTVIGLRSIGAALGALVASACGARRLFSLRPAGDPYRRRLDIAPPLEAALLAETDGLFAVVDEGPGQSGSSLASVAQWLLARGAPARRIVFVTSHDGEPGPAADDSIRAVWSAVRRVCVDFDALFVSPGALQPLADLFGDCVGAATEPISDFSGGAWRAERQDAPPAYKMQERRKFRLVTGEGRFLVKFAGLGAESRRKLEHARALHAAGFAAEPLALRRGLVLERWLEGAPPSALDRMDVARIGAYLGIRAEIFPAAERGASLAELAAMAEQNIGEALGLAVASAVLRPFPAHRLAALGAEARPVVVDGRLHRWEWLRVEGRLVKTDALDHADGHDLVGAQDIGWDVAGAAVEFDLDAPALRRLVGAMPARARPGAELVAFLRVAYLGFQLGLWSFAAASDRRAALQFARYRALLAGGPP